MKPCSLTTIILTYNVEDLTVQCLASLEIAINLFESKGGVASTIVSDNGSKDNTVEAVKEKFPDVTVLENENIGFAKGNNAARNLVDSEYILILNPDTELEEKTLLTCIERIQRNTNIGALTCRTVLPDGSPDKDARRSFPYPFIALTHFSGLDRIFPRSKIFSKYWYGYIPDSAEHEVDVIQGAFCLIRKDCMDKIDWYDEDYFLDGEDIDLCWKIKENGYKIIYFPDTKIIHYKGASKGKESAKELSKKVNKWAKLKATLAGVASMKIFYDKHLKKRYPYPVTLLIYMGIFLLKLKRAVKVVVLGRR